MDESYKGLKAGGNIELVSGTITINSADDSVHAHGNVTLSGAIVTAQSGDDGVHADDTTTISDGTVTIQNSYEGLEGSVVAISGGTVAMMGLMQLAAVTHQAAVNLVKIHSVAEVSHLMTAKKSQSLAALSRLMQKVTV